MRRALAALLQRLTLVTTSLSPWIICLEQLGITYLESTQNNLLVSHAPRPLFALIIVEHSFLLLQSKADAHQETKGLFEDESETIVAP